VLIVWRAAAEVDASAALAMERIEPICVPMGSRHDPASPGGGDFAALSRRRLAHRADGLGGAVEHLGRLLAPEEAMANNLTNELQGCFVKARAADDAVETLSSCLSSRGMEPKDCPNACVFREMNLMLDTYAAAATLNARYSRAEASML
jgi:hypothetical protein